ncbi:LCP family protein [Bacillus timonensis]|nr:LCP family protein [Bacillus timonensis]
MTNRSTFKKKKRRKRALMWVLLPLLLIVTSATVYGAFLVNKAANVAETSKKDLERGEKSEKREKAVNPKYDNISILFMGVDDSSTRKMGSATRTDALILATLNEKQKTVKMVSIPRDSLVYVPVEGKEDKINHAHVFGGVEGTIETVEELFDVPVDYFVKMNFEAFIDVVEALGGIEVDVPITFSEQDSKDRKNAIHLTKGLQMLNGEEALALARTRKIDSDIERGKRQQLVLEAIIKKGSSVTSITKYGDVIEALGDNITTNLRFGEIISLHDYATSGQKLQVQSLHLEGNDLWLPRGYYYQLNEEKLKEISEILRSHLEVNTVGERAQTDAYAKTKTDSSKQ